LLPLRDLFFSRPIGLLEELLLLLALLDVLVARCRRPWPCVGLPLRPVGAIP